MQLRRTTSANEASVYQAPPLHQSSSLLAIADTPRLFDALGWPPPLRFHPQRKVQRGDCVREGRVTSAAGRQCGAHLSRFQRAPGARLVSAPFASRQQTRACGVFDEHECARASVRRDVRQIGMPGCRRASLRGGTARTVDQPQQLLRGEGCVANYCPVAVAGETARDDGLLRQRRQDEEVL